MVAIRGFLKGRSIAFFGGCLLILGACSPTIPPDVRDSVLQQIGFNKTVLLFSADADSYAGALNAYASNRSISDAMPMIAFLYSENLLTLVPIDGPNRFWHLQINRSDNRISLEDNNRRLTVRLGKRELGNLVFQNSFNVGPMEVRSARFAYSIRSEFPTLPSPSNLQVSIVISKSPTTGAWQYTPESALDARDRQQALPEMDKFVNENKARYISQLENGVSAIEQKKNGAIRQQYAMSGGPIVIDKSTNLSWAKCNIAGMATYPTRAQLVTLINQTTTEWKFVSPDRSIEKALDTGNMNYPILDTQLVQSAPPLYKHFTWVKGKGMKGYWYETLSSSPRLDPPRPWDNYLCVR